MLGFRFKIFPQSKWRRWMRREQHKANKWLLKLGEGKAWQCFLNLCTNLNISINKKLREQKDKNTVGQSLHYTQTRRLPVRSHWSEEEIYLQIVLINKSRHWQISGSFLSSLLINTGGRSEANVEENHIPFIKKKTPGKEGIFDSTKPVCVGGAES